MHDGLENENAELAGEAALFYAMAHDLHEQYWQHTYEGESMEIAVSSDCETPEERVKGSKCWFGMTNALRAVAMVQMADRSLPVLDVGTGNGHLCHLLARAGFEAIHGLDYCEEAILIARRLHKDYERILASKESGAEVLEATMALPAAVAEAEEVDILAPGVHFRCGDVLDPPFEPEQFGLLVDKGALDCIGMRVPPESFDGPGFGELRKGMKPLSMESLMEENEETPLELWSGSMHRLIAPGGFLLVVTCCFRVDEVAAVLERCDSMFAEDSIFALVAEHEETEEGTGGVRFCLFSKQPRKPEEKLQPQSR